jgi:hypothetical protein
MNRQTVSLRRVVLVASILCTFGLSACEAGDLDGELDGLAVQPDGLTVGDGITGVGDAAGSDITTGDALDPDASAGACGDGLMDEGESCDDGNSDSGDGCSAACAVEPGWMCDGAGACECAAGFTGADCVDCAEGYQPMDDGSCMSAQECSETYCSSNGTCLYGEEGPPGCDCASGWMGPDCSGDRDECEEAPEPLCVNGGTCVNGAVESIAPECLEAQVDENGAKAPGCAASDTCSAAVCAADSYCCQFAWDEICAAIAHGAGACNNPGWLCECPEGWVGPMCDMDRDECEPSVDPCANDGICVNEPGSFTCSCPWGWTGELCDQNEDECSVVDDLCQNGAACVDMTPEDLAPACLEAQFDSEGEPVSGCESAPECEAVVCAQHHGCCNEGWGEECAAQAANYIECKVPGYVCECAEGWVGDHCGTDVDECADEPCLHAYGCENSPGSYTCSCEPGWAGPGCDENLNECELGEVPCANGSSCLDSEAELIAPECLQAQLDADGLPSPGCESSETCEASVCAYDAHCCTNGWDGICAQEASFDPECNLPGFQCECAEGWTGPLCEWDIDECQGENGCSDTGACVNEPGGYTCACEPGWTGWDCTENDDECAWEESPCQNGGACSDLPPNPPAPDCLNSQQDEEGKWTKGCQAVPECEDAVCALDGYCCEFAWDGLCAALAMEQPSCAASMFECSCTGAWTGPTCAEDVDECLAGADCANGGTCVNEPGTWTCECAAGWTGPQCEENENECAWDVSPCGEASECIDVSPNEDPQGFICECGPGWSGSMCDEVNDPCLALMPCENEGLCSSSDAEYVCECTAAWSGANCDVDVDECGVGISTCSEHAACNNTLGGYDCACNAGYEGDGFECSDFDECESQDSNNCSEQANCLNMIGSYDCACKSGWLGDGVDCENIDECDVEVSPCGDYSTCEDTEGSYVCGCVAGYEPDAALPEGAFACIDIDECAIETDDCGENSQCNNAPSTYECACLWGYSSETGKNCSNVDECGDGTDSCEEGSSCVDSAPYPCSNPDDCDDALCLEAVGAIVDSCLTDWDENCASCAAGGLALNGLDCASAADACTGKGYMCTCEDGWVLSESGLGCDDVDECLDSPCVNKGQCWNGPGGYGCDCGPGWGGMHCEDNIDECAEGICQNDSSCEDLEPVVSGSLCSSGSECDIQSCRDAVAEFDVWCGLGWDSFCAQCAGGGMAFGGIDCSNVGPACSTFAKGFECSCAPSWSGEFCEQDVDECSLEVPICQNDAACENLPGDYVCDCPPGWEGKNCELDIDECLEAPCANGTCENNPGAYACLCDAGWEGQHCEVDIDECALGMCENFATCENSEGSYACNCPTGTTGQNCEQAVDQCSAGVCGLNAIDCLDFQPVLVGGCPSGDFCDDGICRDAVCALDGFCCTDWDGLCAICANTGVGYDGLDCSAAVDSCETAFDGVFDCTCDLGWQGDVCDEDIDECLDNPCINGACTNEPGSFACECEAGWEGEFCGDNINECLEPDTCGGNSTCDDLEAQSEYSHCATEEGCDVPACRYAVGAFDSFCMDDWDGLCAACAVGGADCASIGTECSGDAKPGFQCTCDKGWEGDQCDQNIDECLLEGICGSGTCEDLEAIAGEAVCDTAQDALPESDGGPTCDVPVCRDAVASFDSWCATNWDGACALCAAGGAGFADCTSIGDACHEGVVPGYQCECGLGWEGPGCSNASAVVDLNTGDGCGTYTADFDSGEAGWEVGGNPDPESAVGSPGPLFELVYDFDGGSFFADQLDGTHSRTSISRDFLLPADLPALLSFDVVHDVVESCSPEDYDSTWVFVNDLPFEKICSPEPGVPFIDNVNVDLSGFAGQPVTVKIEFDTGDDAANSGNGVYIDDITVTTCP